MDASELQDSFVVLAQQIAFRLYRTLRVRFLLPNALLVQLHRFLPHVSCLQLLLAQQTVVLQLQAVLFQFPANRLRVSRRESLVAKVDEDLVEGTVLLLHLLMVTAALLGLPTLHEGSHALEDLVGAAEVAMHEVATVKLEEPVVEFVLVVRPVSLLHVLGLFAVGFLVCRVLPLGLFLVLFPCQANVTFLAEERVEVVPWNYFLIFFRIAVNFL